MLRIRLGVYNKELLANKIGKLRLLYEGTEITIRILCLGRRTLISEIPPQPYLRNPCLWPRVYS